MLNIWEHVTATHAYSKNARVHTEEGNYMREKTYIQRYVLHVSCCD
jgi:hypothetical protein